MTSTDLPYWLVNVPEDQRSSTCPDFLVNASAKDQRILSTPDRHYHVLTWAEVQDIVRESYQQLLFTPPSPDFWELQRADDLRSRNQSHR